MRGGWGGCGWLCRKTQLGCRWCCDEKTFCPTFVRRATSPAASIPFSFNYLDADFKVRKHSCVTVLPHFVKYSGVPAAAPSPRHSLFSFHFGRGASWSVAQGYQPWRATRAGSQRIMGHASSSSSFVAFGGEVISRLPACLPAAGAVAGLVDDSCPQLPAGNASVAPRTVHRRHIEF